MVAVNRYVSGETWLSCLSLPAARTGSEVIVFPSFLTQYLEEAACRFLPFSAPPNRKSRRRQREPARAC